MDPATAAVSLKLRCRSFVVIPARWASTRLPGKMLLRSTGKPLVQHTWEAASLATRPWGLCVATDDDQIAREVRRFGGQVEMTRADAASGTDRVAEVAARMPDTDIFVNVQGDEPEISPPSIDRVIELLESHPQADVATLAAPLRDVERLADPACVKVVFDSSGRALYFSRSPIPHARAWDDRLLEADPPLFFQHLGIYAYRRAFLLQLSSLPPSHLERLECLEQLRVLAAGRVIQVGLVQRPTRGIDTPDDYRAFVSRSRS